jgi:hypothetical protein
MRYTTPPIFKKKNSSLDLTYSCALQLPGEGGKPTWKPVFLVLTDKDMLLYDTAPWSKEEWATPFQDHQLLATR